MSSRKGFTLIELLVVIAIIGILSSVVMVNLSAARIKGRDVKRVADIGQVRIALEMYYDQFNRYPDILDDLETQGLMGEVPLDPSGASYAYTGLQVAGECLGYHVAATLEDTAHQALSSDEDFDSTAETACGAGVVFDGAAAGVYDFRR